MAEDTITQTDSSTSGEDGSSVQTDATALTPEQRDAQTFAKYGLTPQGTRAEAAATTEETPEMPDAKPDDEKPEGDQTDDSDDKPATTTAEGDTAGDTTADDTDDTPEITDEEVDQVIDALKERLIANPKLADEIRTRAEAEATRRFEEQRQSQTTSQETERLIEQGRTAATKLYGLLNGFGEQLEKAAKGEKFDVVTPDPKQLQIHLGEFGAAVVAETRRHFDDGFTTAFREVGQKLDIKFDKDDAETIKKIIQTTERIESDPEQGRGPAIAHLYGESWKLLATKAREQGRADALAEVKRQKDATAAIRGKNAETSAIAKITKERKGLPAKPVAVDASSVSTASDDISDDAYRAAKLKARETGDSREVDRIVQQRALAAAGR
jgi:hypothetical protein